MIGVDYPDYAYLGYVDLIRQYIAEHTPTYILDLSSYRRINILSLCPIVQIDRDCPPRYVIWNAMHSVVLTVSCIITD
jgi:hypothetical protein